MFHTAVVLNDNFCGCFETANHINLNDNIGFKADRAHIVQIFLILQKVSKALIKNAQVKFFSYQTGISTLCSISFKIKK